MIRPRRFYPFACSLLLLVLCGAQSASAQGPAVRLPRASQKATIMQTIGVTDVTVIYSRPAVKGREGQITTALIDKDQLVRRELRLGLGAPSRPFG